MATHLYGFCGIGRQFFGLNGVLLNSEHPQKNSLFNAATEAAYF